MKQIRRSVFETNSSSVHALCMIKDNTEDIEIALENLTKYDKLWDEYKIICTIDEGNYDTLSDEVKTSLKVIGFDEKSANADSDYTYNLLSKYSNNYNGCSGMAGEFEIKRNVIQSLFENYKNVVDNNITFDEFVLKFNWEEYNLNNIFDIEIDQNKNKTKEYLKNYFKIFEWDGYDEICSDFYTMKDGTDVYQLINDYESKAYIESEIAKKGVKKVKKEFYKFYKFSDMEEIIDYHQQNRPLTFKYLKENNIL